MPKLCTSGEVFQLRMILDLCCLDIANLVPATVLGSLKNGADCAKIVCFDRSHVQAAD